MAYKKEIKICECCGVSFYGIKTRKYCGYKCSKKVREKKILKICETCGKEYYVQLYRKYDNKYCSASCKAKKQSSDTIEIKCTNCQKSFKRKSHKISKTNNFCCHKCSAEYNSGKNHYEWKQDRCSANYKNALKKWSLQIKENAKYICKECGESDKDCLQSHHIKHKSSHPELSLDLTNGICLCMKCHLEKHKDDKKSYRLIKSSLNKYLKTKSN